MVNYIQSKYDELKSHAERNVVQHGHGYMWYISMLTLSLLVYVIYSYVDTGVTRINIVYIAVMFLSVNTYIINTISETQKSNDTPTEQIKQS